MGVKKFLSSYIDNLLNYFGYFKVEQNQEEEKSVLTNEYPYVAFEIREDKIWIYVNTEERDEKDIALLLHQLSSGQMKQTIMSVLIEILEEDVADRILGEWGALEISHQVVLYNQTKNNRPIVRPLEFFKETTK